MTGDIDTATHSLPPAPLHHGGHDARPPGQPLPHTAQQYLSLTGSVAHSSVSLWLRGVGLAGYSSTLETNGFDHLIYIVSHMTVTMLVT